MDFLSLGIDVSTWDTAKEQTLERFIVLFEKLEKFDGKVFNPIMGNGLAEFNTSVAATTKLLDELNAKLASVGSNTKQTQKSTENLTDAEKLLVKQTEEYNALLAKMNALTTAEAKANMAAKLELSEKTKAMLEEAKAANASVQAKLAAKQAEKDIAAQRKADLAQQRQDNLALARAERDANAQRRQNIADSKAAARAAREESAADKVLTNDLLLLKKAFQDQSVRYANLHINNGAGAASTKAALADLTATGAIIGQVEGNIRQATTGSKAFGGALTSVFSQIRTLAYILPGIGIAGIFNLAFEAIGEVVKELGFFDDKQLDILKKQTLINKSLNEEYQILKAINEQRKDLFETSNVTSARSSQAIIDKFAAAGLNKTSLSGLKVFNAQTEFNEAQGRINKSGDPETAKAEIEKSIKLQDELQKKIVTLDKFIDTTKDFTKIQSFQRILLGIPDVKEVSKETLEKRKSELLLESNINQDKIKNLTDYVTKKEKLDQAIAENTKQLQDDELNKTTELAKDKISINQEVNKKTLDDDISSYNQKRKAILALYDDQVKLNKIELSKTTSITGRYSQSEIDIAESKASTDNEKARIEKNKKLLDLDEEYKQRLLKAETEINKSILHEEAIKNEKIANNEQNTLEERIRAQIKYFKALQDIQDLELKKDLQKRSLLAKGSVPQKEIEEAVRLSNEQKANIVADTEKKIYDITYTSTQKRLKLIKELNATEDGEDKAKYTEELRKLNESFENKTIKYKQYKKERAEIDNQYSRLSIIGAIKDDKSDIDRLEGVLETLNRKQVTNKSNLGAAQDAYSSLPGIGTKQDLDTAKGEYEGFAQTILDTEKELGIKIEKLRDDELKLQLKRYEKEKDAKKDMWKALQQIEQSIYDTVKTIGDSEYNDRIQRSQAIQEVVQEQYQSEIDAVEKSTLSSKSKAALDIQLNAQRTESAKNAEAEQKKIAYDKAVFDRDLAITHIILSTAEAVAALLETPWLAVAAGVAGTAELIKAESVKIPSYAEGTESHPGGMARFGEDGTEVIKEPYKQPYYVMKETIGYLPVGTKVTPIEESPNFGEGKKLDTMEPFIWLAKQLKPKKQSNYFSPTINIDLGFEQFKHKKLYGR